MSGPNRFLWKLLADACALNQSPHATADEILVKISGLRSVMERDAETKSAKRHNAFPFKSTSHVSGENGVISISPNDICYVPNDLSRRTLRIADSKSPRLGIYPRRLARPELVSDIACDTLIDIASDYLLSSVIFYIEIERVHDQCSTTIPFSLSSSFSCFKTIQVIQHPLTSDLHIPSNDSAQRVEKPQISGPMTLSSPRKRFSSLISFGITNLNEFDIILIQGLRVVLHVAPDRRLFRLLNYSQSLNSLVFLKQVDADHFADFGERLSLRQVDNVTCLGVSNIVMQTSCNQLYGQSLSPSSGSSVDDDYKSAINRIFTLNLNSAVNCFSVLNSDESERNFLNIEVQPISKLSRQELFSAIKMAVGVAVCIETKISPRRVIRSARDSFFPSTDSPIYIADTDELIAFRESQVECNDAIVDNDNDEEKGQVVEFVPKRPSLPRREEML